ncbi:biotin transporter BioY [Cocleimonas flava]|uniref:Biotin transporter n=1 Tax=Cocleimonas flava TaxID=634765 RepID=A0A4R1EYM1_9GAMM|nr:biotin transporter BioY [Cocleimonas flava]TCJ85009.1 biotin transport system substrate-specific component [Cocleimonas flava]
MFFKQITYPTLIQEVSGLKDSMLTKVFLALVGSLALWASAKISIPFYPVPMTMQTFVVLMIGMSYGAKLGGATITLYLVEGALGLPVFSGSPERGIGLAYMFGPTGGYLLGFLVSAVTVGILAERGFGKNILSTLISMTIGTAIIFAFGLLWLGSIIGWDASLLELGFTPFALGAILKIGLAALSLPLAWKLLGKKS